MEPQATSVPQMPPIPPNPATPQIKNSLVLIMSILLIVTVAIAGLFYFQIQKLSKELSKYQVQPSPTPIATTDPTANWKTYTSNALGVSFKHPGDWVITERDTYVVLLKDPDIRTVVGACPGYSFSVSKYDPYLNYSRFDKVTKSSLNGESTEIWTNNDLGCKEKFIFVNSLPSNTIKPKYIISFVSKNSDGDILFDQILSTFKFLGNNTSTNNGASCQYKGKIYNDGDAVPSGDKCNSCSCENGEVACTLMFCQ